MIMTDSGVIVRATDDDYEPNVWPHEVRNDERAALFDGLHCWICGEKKQLTREHIWKNSQMKVISKILGNGIEIMDPRSGQKRRLQSSDSKFIKSRPCICAYCNNKRTQNADRTFDKIHRRAASGVFFHHPRNGPTMIRSGKEQNDLELYFVKLLGCVMADQDIPIPMRFSEALMQNDARRANIIYFIATTASIRSISPSLPINSSNGLGSLMIMLRHHEKPILGGCEFSVQLGPTTFGIYTAFYGDELDVLNQNIPAQTLENIAKRPLKDWVSCPSFLLNRKENERFFIQMHGETQSFFRQTRDDSRSGSAHQTSSLALPLLRSSPYG